MRKRFLVDAVLKHVVSSLRVVVLTFDVLASFLQRYPNESVDQNTCYFEDFVFPHCVFSLIANFER